MDHVVDLRDKPNRWKKIHFGDGKGVHYFKYLDVFKHILGTNCKHTCKKTSMTLCQKCSSQTGELDSIDRLPRH